MRDKFICEYDPPNLFLNRAIMQSMLEDDERLKRQTGEKDNFRNNCLTAVLAAVSPAVTLFSTEDVLTKYINWVLLIIIAVLFIWNLSKYFTLKTTLSKENYDSEKSYLKVLQEAKKNTRYTAVLLISSRSENEPLKFLCRKGDSFLVHCKMDPQKTIAEQNAPIKTYLKVTFGLNPSDIFDISPLDQEPFFTVKPVYNEMSANAFVLYAVKIDERVRNIFEKENYMWCSIEEMQSDPKAMKLNYDIIDKLDTKRANLTESFRTRSSDLHVIWNITKECPYHCIICATSDKNREELTLENKLKILFALCREKRRIKTLDFAGGDPCFSPESQVVIQAAIDMFGKEVISVTTTAEGIKSLSEDAKHQLLSRCEITIDASHENLSQPIKEGINRNEIKYSSSNAKLIHLFSDSVHNLTINIPILNCDLRQDEIAHLVSIILEIKNTYPNLEIETHIIRLMPVGGYAQNCSADQYRNYNPIDVAKTIKDELYKNKIACSYHCSLRTLDTFNNGDSRCSMLKHKIGIDCAGNVFACAWGAYLPEDDICDNPFYLGNLTKQSLADILNKNSTVAYKRIMNQIKNKKEIHYCEVVSRFFNNDSQENNDPLAQFTQSVEDDS